MKVEKIELVLENCDSITIFAKDTVMHLWEVYMFLSYLDGKETYQETIKSGHIVFDLDQIPLQTDRFKEDARARIQHCDITQIHLYNKRGKEIGFYYVDYKVDKEEFIGEPNLRQKVSFETDIDGKEKVIIEWENPQ